MSLQIYSSEPCWKILYNKLKLENINLCKKNIALSINEISIVPNKKNILWLHESPAILENIVNKIENNEEFFKNNFYCVYSCIKKLQKYSFVKYIHPSNSSWIETPIFNLNKSKNISMITSNKNFTIGHKIRNHIAKNLPSFVDLYGKGYNEIEKKDIGLVDYRFSISIENDDSECYFSEKLIDCFLTSTIPIYWGSKCVSNIFNNDGIIWLNDINNLNDYDENYYKSKENAIKENYFLALKNNIDPYESLKNILMEN